MVFIFTRVWKTRRPSTKIWWARVTCTTPPTVGLSPTKQTSMQTKLPAGVVVEACLLWQGIPQRLRNGRCLEAMSGRINLKWKSSHRYETSAGNKKRFVWVSNDEHLLLISISFLDNEHLKEIVFFFWVYSSFLCKNYWFLNLK